MTEQTFTEKIQAAGDQLVDTVKRLASEGNVRKITLRSGSGRELFSLPLTAGVLVGGVAVFAAPTLAAITAIATLFSSVTVEVVRDVPGASKDPQIIDVDPID